MKGRDLSEHFLMTKIPLGPLLRDVSAEGLSLSLAFTYYLSTLPSFHVSDTRREPGAQRQTVLVPRVGPPPPTPSLPSWTACPRRRSGERGSGTVKAVGTHPGGLPGATGKGPLFTVARSSHTRETCTRGAGVRGGGGQSSEHPLRGKPSQPSGGTEYQPD